MTLTESERLKIIERYAELARAEIVELEKTGQQKFDEAITDLERLTKNSRVTASELRKAEQRVEEAEGLLRNEQDVTNRATKADKEQRRAKKTEEYQDLFRRYDKAVKTSNFEAARKLQAQVDKAYSDIDKYAETGIESEEE